MNTSRKSRSAVDVIVDLRNAYRFSRLAKICPPAYRHAFYRLKHLALARALSKRPEQFIVDSLTAGRSPILGLAHPSSGWRGHIPVRQLPAETQTLLYRLAASYTPTCPPAHHAAIDRRMAGEARHA